MGHLLLLPEAALKMEQLGLELAFIWDANALGNDPSAVDPERIFQCPLWAGGVAASILEARWTQIGVFF